MQCVYLLIPSSEIIIDSLKCGSLLATPLLQVADLSLSSDGFIGYAPVFKFSYAPVFSQWLVAQLRPCCQLRPCRQPVACCYLQN